MFVVMAIGASEAEILGVKSQILAEGMTAYDHAGAVKDLLDRGVVPETFVMKIAPALVEKKILPAGFP